MDNFPLTYAAMGNVKSMTSHKIRDAQPNENITCSKGNIATQDSFL